MWLWAACVAVPSGTSAPPSTATTPGPTSGATVPTEAPVTVPSCATARRSTGYTETWSFPATDAGRVLVVSGAALSRELTAETARGVLTGRDDYGAFGDQLAWLGRQADGVGKLAISDRDGAWVVDPGALSGEAVVTAVPRTRLSVDDQLAAMTSLSDFDGDGLRELVLSGPLDTNRVVAPGEIALYGSTSLVAGASLGPAAALTRVTDALGEGIGYQLVEAGDVDGDGRSDLCTLVFEPADADGGRVDVWLGATLSQGGLLDGAAADARLYEDGELFLTCPSLPLGDLDGDGQDDLLIGDQVLPGAALQGTVDPFTALAWQDYDPDTQRFPLPWADLDADGVTELRNGYGFAGETSPWFRVDVIEGASLGPDYVLAPFSASEISRFHPAVEGGRLPDLDGDGVPEVWLTLQQGAAADGPLCYDWRLFSGASVLDGSWSIEAPLAFLRAGAAPPVATALDDFDGDGLPELALSDPMPFAQ